MERSFDYNVSTDLERLKKYLNYEVSSSILYFLSFMAMIFLFLALLAAIIFTPFMLRVLYKEKKKSWIVLFIVIVILPVIIFSILAVFFKFSVSLLLIPIGLFYFFCFMLRFSVNGWIRESEFRKKYLKEKEERENEMKLFWKQLE